MPELCILCKGFDLTEEASLHGDPLCGTQARQGEEALGRAEQAVRQDGLLRRRVDSMHCSVVMLLWPKPRGGGVRGGSVLFPSLHHSAHSCVTSPMPDKGSVFRQPSPPWWKMI